MKISVIVPVFNGQDYLERCLDSILNQSFKDIELIVVNDGSVDGTKSIIEKYSKLHPNMIAIHKINEGLPQARKTGVEAATGAYIGFVDADDYLEPDMYQELYRVCRKYKADVACAEIFVNHNEKETVLGSGKERVYSGKNALIELNKRKNVFTNVWNKLYRTECFNNIIFPNGNFVGEDYFIVTQILENAEKVVQLDKPLYHYVQTVESMSRGGYTENYWLSFKYYIDRYKCLKNKYPDITIYIKDYLTIEFLGYVTAMGKNGNYDIKMLENIKKFIRRSFFHYIAAGYVEIKYKLGAVAFLLDYRILIWGYKKLLT